MRRLAPKSLLGAMVLALWACQNAPPVPKADETPERQFIIEQFAFEERRDGRLIWQGHAARSSGDMTTSDVSDVALVRTPQRPSEQPLHIRADTAHLALAEGHAHFYPLLAYDMRGRRLQGRAADYDEAQSTLKAEGPILVTAPQAHVRASAATLYIDTGRLVLQGPVQGRIDLGARNPTP